MVMFFASAVGRITPIAASITGTTSRGCRSSESWPVIIRETSSMAQIIDDILDVSRNNSRDVEYVVDDLSLRLRISTHRFNCLPRGLFIQVTTLEQSCPPEYRGEWCSHFVRHRREKLIFQPVGFFRGFTR